MRTKLSEVAGATVAYRPVASGGTVIPRESMLCPQSTAYASGRNTPISKAAHAQSCALRCARAYAENSVKTCTAEWRSRCQYGPLYVLHAYGYN